MKETRGRPKEQTLEDQPRQWTRTFKNEDGTIDVWKYNLDINPNGPISTEVTNEKAKKTEEKSKEDQEKDNSLLPKTVRKYLNPANGKMVGYMRAKQLRII